MVGKENVSACLRARGASWFGLLPSLTSLLTSFEIVAKGNSPGWRHRTMMLSAQLGGTHFTDVRACSGVIKVKWCLVERILEMSLSRS